MYVSCCLVFVYVVRCFVSSFVLYVVRYYVCVYVCVMYMFSSFVRYLFSSSAMSLFMFSPFVSYVVISLVVYFVRCMYLFRPWFLYVFRSLYSSLCLSIGRSLLRYVCTSLCIAFVMYYICMLFEVSLCMDASPFLALYRHIRRPWCRSLVSYVVR